MYSGMVCSSCSTNATRRVTLVENPLISHGGVWDYEYDKRKISPVICHPNIL